MSVLYTPEMEEYLDEMESILYEKGYYGTEEQACKYVDDLTNDIENNLPYKRHRPAPNYKGTLRFFIFQVKIVSLLKFNA